MKKALTLALILILAMSVLFVPSGMARTVSMIDDFEPDGTNLAGGYWSAQWDIGVDDTVAKNGTSSLKITNSTAYLWPELHSAASTHNFDVSDMTHVEAWVKTSETTEKGSFVFRMQFVDGDGNKWYNYNVSLDKEETESDFVLASLPLADFMDFASSSEYYDPAVNSPIIKSFIFILVGTPAEVYDMWLDDLAIVNPTAEPAPVIPEPDAPDLSGYLTAIQDFDSVSSVEDTGFAPENPGHNIIMALETSAENVHDGTQSLKMTLTGEQGYAGTNVILNNEVDIAGYDYLEAWIKTSATDIKGTFDVRTRLNLGGTWFYAITTVYKAHTEADFVQIRVPLTELTNGVANFDPESDVTAVWMYQIDFTTVLEPFDVWLDGIALVSNTAPGEEEVYYEVSFNSMGGSAVEDQRILEGEKAVKPADPTRSGYEFVEWQISDGSSYAAFDFDTVITEDIVLRALWKEAGSSDDNNDDDKKPDTGDALPFVLAGLTLSVIAAGLLSKKKYLLGR